MPDVARNHHFIPEFLLANFTPSGTRDSFLWVTDRQQRKGYLANPRNAGFQKDLYRFDVEGTPPDIVERMLGRFEAHVAPAVKHLLQRHCLPARPEFDALMELIGLLAIRVPSARKKVDLAIDKSLKRMCRQIFKSPEALRALCQSTREEGVQGIDDDNTDYEEFWRFVQDESQYTLSLEKEWVLFWILQTSEQAQMLLFHRNWTVLVAQDDAGHFICSDAPVCLTRTDLRRDRQAPRLDYHETDLTVPLGNRVALLGRYEARQDSMVVCDRKRVAHINARTIGSGERFLYSSNKDFPWERDDGSTGNWDSLIADLRDVHKGATNTGAAEDGE
ncbi:MAG: DUF4238 domain-containing protein [Deltaproteobacteria bacterium]|nr:DUF4238 domain-containing protein [Deltaproteobacteria bacterium]